MSHLHKNVYTLSITTMKVAKAKKSSAPQKPCWTLGFSQAPVVNLPFGQSAVGLHRRVGRFGGRVHPCDTKPMMHALRRSTTGPLAERTDDHSSVLTSGVSRVSRSVRSGTPFSPDTLFDGVRRCGATNHGKESEVSRVSRVILKTIACGGVHTHTSGRGCSKKSFSKQPGHPGHLRKVTMLRAVSGLLQVDKGVRADSVLEWTPPGQNGHPVGWCA